MSNSNLPLLSLNHLLNKEQKTNLEKELKTAFIDCYAKGVKGKGSMVDGEKLVKKVFNPVLAKHNIIPKASKLEGKTIKMQEMKHIVSFTGKNYEEGSIPTIIIQVFGWFKVLGGNVFFKVEFLSNRKSEVLASDFETTLTSQKLIDLVQEFDFKDYKREEGVFKKLENGDKEFVKEKDKIDLLLKKAIKEFSTQHNLNSEEFKEWNEEVSPPNYFYTG